MKIDISIPNEITLALSLLEENGHEAYAVGGCVRDLIIGVTPKDWDLCTSAMPSDIIDVFKDYKTIPTGLKQGTVTVVINHFHIEITTYRKDSEYSDHRRPNEVEYVSDLKTDLERRDFTINSLALSKDLVIKDYFSSERDINNGIIKCVGDADKRFSEDSLRILRALRFSSCLGFKIDDKTDKAIRKNISLLKYVSKERIRDELLKTLCGDNILNILLDYKDVFTFIIPDLLECTKTKQLTPHHQYDVYEHIAHTVMNIEPDYILRMSMLLHDIGKPAAKTVDEYGVMHFKKHQEISYKLSIKILDDLKFSSKDKTLISLLVKEHDNRFPATKEAVSHFLSKYSEDFFRYYIKIRIADTLAQSEYLRDEKLGQILSVKTLGDEIIKNSHCLKISDLAIDGNDLVALGFKGEEIGEALKFSLENVLNDKIKNEKQELLSLIKSRKG